MEEEWRPDKNFYSIIFDMIFCNFSVFVIYVIGIVPFFHTHVNTSVSKLRNYFRILSTAVVITQHFPDFISVGIFFFFQRAKQCH